MTYKNDIFNRLGGECQYDMIIVNFAESLIKNRILTKFFGQFSLESLTKLQREVLDLALLEQSEEEEVKTIRRVLLLHYRLFENGLNGSHFAAIREHLVSALHSVWADSDVIDDITSQFDSLEEGFFGTGWNKIHYYPLSQTTTTTKEEQEDNESDEELPLKSEDGPTPSETKKQRTRRPSGESLLTMLMINAHKRAKASPVPSH